MENSRHEKVMIIIAAYVIGFVTAYIAYGIAKVNEQYPNEPVVKAIEHSQREEIENTTPSLKEDDLGLYFHNAEKNRLLTANQAALYNSGTSYGTSPTNGEYYDVVGMSVAPNEKFAYFCEQLSPEEEMCDPFIYDVTTDTLHRLTRDGETIQMNISEQNVTWGERGKLFAPGFESTSLEEPWH